jgi:transcriptional regulator with XRE-family HTH domain/DNA-directed RNA polymerase subunit K/omega
MAASVGQSLGMSLGDRLAFYIRASNLTQVAVATRAGVSEEYLRLLLRGARTPSVPVLYNLAKALGIQPGMLLAEPDIEQESLQHSAGPAIAAAMLDYGRTPGAEAPDLQLLRDRVTEVWRTWQSEPARIAATTPNLPDLIRDVGRATRSFTASGDVEQRREAHRIAADLYLLVRAVCKYTHRYDLMVVAAERAVQAAEQADDPLRLAGAMWNLAQAMGNQGGGELALDIATQAIEDLEPEREREGPGQSTALAVTGALHQTAAVAEGRLGDHWAALSRIRTEVFPLAERVGEHEAFWLVFGPANARLHMLAIQMEAGEAAEALHIADELDPSTLRSVERRASYLLDVARSYEYDRNDHAVLLALLRLEREAPDDLRMRAASRELVRTLLHRARPTFAPEVRALARRMGLISA